MVNSRGNIPRPGVVPKFSDLEVVALSMTAEALSIDSENLLFHLLNESKSDFPNLISRCQYNQRRKYLSEFTNAIRYNIAMCIDAGEKYFLVDSKPLPVCRSSRAHRSKMGKRNDALSPDFGYCATQQQYYYGYKMHLTCGLSGVIRTFTFSPASVADIHYLRDVKYEIPDSTIIADRAYLSATVQLDLFECANIRLEVPINAIRKSLNLLITPLQKRVKNRNHIFSTQRPVPDDSKLCKGLRRIFNKNTCQNHCFYNI